MDIKIRKLDPTYKVTNQLYCGLVFKCMIFIETGRGKGDDDRCMQQKRKGWIIDDGISKEASRDVLSLLGVDDDALGFA